MGGHTERWDDGFFDTREEVTSESDDFCSDACPGSGGNRALGYELWTKNLDSVNERRNRFLKWMGLHSGSQRSDANGLRDDATDETELSTDRLGESNEAVLANLDIEDQYFSGRMSQSAESNEALDLEKEEILEANHLFRIRNLDTGTELVVDELGHDGTLSRLHEVGSNRTFSVEELHRTLGSSAFVRQLLRRDAEGSNMVNTKKKVKLGWLQKLSLAGRKAEKMNGISFKQETSLRKDDHIQRVRVHTSKKQSKELSSLFTGQEFSAHEGSISTMKFSPDGHYLASAGKDGIVRVWKVVEDEISGKINIQDMDPSCLYFSLNHSSELAPLNFDKEKIGEMRKLKISSELACVVLPEKVFQLLEKPLHEFHGHMGEVLALSWSKNAYLLSSSVDKTARLWKVGDAQCQGIYSHNNYVTCVEFNPVNDNHFISGSLDGKLRLWEVHGCRVIDWTDIKEIVTALSYSPNGKGGIVGTMDGNCRFYDIVDNRLQMGSVVSLQGKKKFTHKRIIGFQFCPSDACKVLVSSADSQVQMISGENITCKFKGMKKSSVQGSASFTSDGGHVVSAGEDSNVCVWNYNSQDQTSQAKSIRSCESFLSRNASIALPWFGLKTKPETLPGSMLPSGHCDKNLPQKMLPSLPDCFSLGRSFFLDSVYKGTATWPEEKLPNSGPVAVSPSVPKTEYKFLKSALQSAFSYPHLWGLVIVTAGWDGCIRTFLNYGLPIRF